MEEFNIVIEVKDYFDTSVHQYPDFKIKLIAFKVEWISGSIELKTHKSYKWTTTDKIDKYDFAEAVIPFINKLKEEML